MKRIILIIALLPILLIGQTKNIVPRADSQGRLGTASKAWLAIHADSMYLLGSPLQDVLLEKDFTDAYSSAAEPTAYDAIPIYNSSDGNRYTSLSNLPPSSQTISLLNNKVNINTANGNQPSYTARQQYIDSLFTSLTARVEALEGRDSSVTPYTPTNFAVDVIAATSSTGSFRLSWTPNGGDSVRIYRNGVYLTRVPISQTSYVTSGYTPHVGTYTFRIQASTDEGEVSNLNESIENQISKFMTRNYYTSNSDLGNGTSSATAEHFAYFGRYVASTLQEGDTVFIDGGASSMVYNNATALYPRTSGRSGGFVIDGVNGTSANRIVWTRNKESGHNGRPIIRYNAIYNYFPVVVANSSFLEFSYLEFDTTRTGDGVTASIILTPTCSDIDIKYNTFNHLTRGGIQFECDNVRILYNEFYSDLINTTTHDAIRTNTPMVMNNPEIAYNKIYQRCMSETTTMHVDGMQLNHVAGTTLIHDNFIVRYVDDRVYDYYLDPSGAASTAVYLDNGAEGDVYIWNNIFVDIGYSGFQNTLSIKNEESTGSIHIYVYNNTFYGGTMDLACNNLSDNSIVFKNNLSYHQGKVTSGVAWDIGVDPNQYGYDSYDFDYNRYYSPYVDHPITHYTFAEIEAYSNDLSFAGWKDSVGDANSGTQTTGFTVIDNTSDDPLDWRLEEGSEGIDDGVDLSDVFPFTVYGTQDYFGVPRTGTWDIGACEGNSTYIAPVTDLAANGGSGEVVFTWTDVTGAAGYVVYGGSSPNPTDSVGFVTQGTQTWTKTGLSTGVIYYARLKTRDASYNYSAYSTQASDYTDGGGGSQYLDQFADADYTASPAWTVVSGTFAVNNSAPIPYDDNDYSLNSTATGFIYTPSSQAYGTWIFDLRYQSLATGDRWYNFINAGTTTTSNGYALIINWQGFISVRRYSGGSFTIPFTNNTGTLFSDGVWYRIKIVRNQTTDQYVTGAAGTFGIYLSTDGSTYNLISADVGKSNPFTNNDITTSTNFSVYAEGANSRISNIMAY